MLDDSHDAQALLGVDDTIHDWNAAATALFGWSREEAVGRAMRDVTVPRELHGLLNDNYLNHMLVNGGELRDRRFEIEKVDRHGRRFPAEVRLWVVTLSGETFQRASIRDLSTAPRSEAKRRLDRWVRASRDAILVADREFEIVEWSAGAERLFGHPRACAVGLPVALIVPPRRRSEMRRLRRELTDGDGVVCWRTCRLDRRGKEFDVEVTLTRHDEPPSFVASYRRVAGAMTRANAGS